MPSIKKLNINLYDEVSEKVKVSCSVLSLCFTVKNNCLFLNSAGFNLALWNSYIEQYQANNFT